MAAPRPELASELYTRLRDAFSPVIVGQDDIIDRDGRASLNLPPTTSKRARLCFRSS